MLDLVDIFVKKQPTSPLIARLIFPLVELVVSTGPDEKQLSDKATGILRSRIGKSKEFPSDVSKEDAAKTLEELHILARKASSPDVLATLNQGSLYLSRVLLHLDDVAPVLSAYRESLRDFVTRKASKLNAAFINDFVKRHTQAAWTMRDDLVKASGEALNGYRQAQVFHLVQTLVNQLQALVGPPPRSKVRLELTVHTERPEVRDPHIYDFATQGPSQNDDKGVHRRINDSPACTRQGHPQARFGCYPPHEAHCRKYERALYHLAAVKLE